MPVIEILAKVLLALAVVAFVGYPLLKEQWGDDDDFELSEETEDLHRRKESTYSALKELEFDYKTGKLSEQDYRELDARYKAQAIEILEAIDQLERPQPKGKSAKASRPGSASAACASCGRVNLPDARFCASCGGPLGPAAAGPPAQSSEDSLSLLCDACGVELAPGHRFCGSCGMQVQA